MSESRVRPEIVHSYHIKNSVLHLFFTLLNTWYFIFLQEKLVRRQWGKKHLIRFNANLLRRRCFCVTSAPEGVAKKFVGHMTVVFKNPVVLNSFQWHTDLQWSYKCLKCVAYMNVCIMCCLYRWGPFLGLSIRNCPREKCVISRWQE